MTVEIWMWLIFAALCFGISKAGFSGVSLVAVFIFADVFGAKESLGIVLPLLIMADFIVYPAFRKHGSWAQVWKLMHPALVGMGLAIWILSDVSNDFMRKIIGVIILALVTLQILRSFYKEKIEALAKTGGFGFGVASAGGVATVLANAAGPIFKLYLLSLKMPKMELVGVSARFFLLVNLLKLPLNAGLDLMSKDTLMINLYLAPAVAAGIFGGKWLLTKVSQKVFEYLVVFFALVAGIRMVWF